MINETHDTYQYLKPKSDSFSKSDFIIPGKEPIDIILELNHLKCNQQFASGYYFRFK